jgi:hypothetical protein
VSYGTRDVETPVAALGYVLGVSEGEHQFVTCFGVLGDSEAAGFDAGGETEVGEGGSYYVEGWATGFTEVRD